MVLFIIIYFYLGDFTHIYSLLYKVITDKYISLDQNLVETPIIQTLLLGHFYSHVSPDITCARLIITRNHSDPVSLCSGKDTTNHAVPQILDVSFPSILIETPYIFLKFLYFSPLLLSHPNLLPSSHLDHLNRFQVFSLYWRLLLTNLFSMEQAG